MFDYPSKGWLLAAIFLLVPSWSQPAAAQDHLHAQDTSRTITLDEIVEQIDIRNPTLRAARLRAEALGTVPDQVSAWPDPTVAIGYQPVPMLTAHGAQRTQWSVEQSIPYPGKLSLKEEIAAFEAKAAAYEGDALLDDLVLQAREAYYELYRLNETERLLVRFRDELTGHVEATAVQYEVGQGPQQAVLKAQLAKNQIAQRLHHIEGARRRTAETLTRLTNHPEGPHHFLVVEPVLARAKGFGSEALMETALRQRPEFAALEAAAERASRELELARKEGFPDVALRITYFDIASSDLPATATGRDAVAVGASIKIPLQRGRIAAQIEEARLRQTQIEAHQEALRKQFRTQIEALLASLDHEALAMDEYEEVLLPQAAATIEATLNAYAAGTATFLDLLDAEQTAFTIRTSFVDAAVRYLTLTARLERVLGVRALEEAGANSSSAETLPLLHSIRETE